MSKVYLDHLIPRDSFRYVDQRVENGSLPEDTYKQSDIRLRDIAEEWFLKLRKPDFQRETNSWTPQSCVDLIKSVINGDVIPGIIAWKNIESSLIYIIDGAHRLSVIRAWMLDDWGDSRVEYYNEHHRPEIIGAATEIRGLIEQTVGSYSSFKDAHKKLRDIIKEGIAAPKAAMPPQQFQQATFYDAITDGAWLVTQWVRGNYQEAERSFLQINRSGERLDAFEQLLIEFRNGPYARVVSSIVSAGRTGNFWPQTGLDEESKGTVKEFPAYAEAIHNIMFRPPFDGEIRDINQPMVVSRPGERYEDGLELVALIAGGRLLSSDEAKKECLEKESSADAQTVIGEAKEIFQVVLDRLSQLIGENTNPKSLGIVPLIYTYNHQGVYSRNLLYGFAYWLFTGNEETIKKRKISLSVVRGVFERILMDFKAQITSVASRKGGSFKSTKDIAESINSIISLLIASQGKSYHDICDAVRKHLTLGHPESDAHRGRSVTRGQRNQVNISSLFENSVRCPICDGVIDLRQGKQYDHHFQKFSQVKITEARNIKPTHPFCNNMREQIESAKKAGTSLEIPRFSAAENSAAPKKQLTLF